MSVSEFIESIYAVRFAYLQYIDKLRVGDVTVLVLIKVVEDDAKLLSGEEDSKLRHELLKLKLLEDAVLIAVEALHTEQTKKMVK